MSSQYQHCSLGRLPLSLCRKTKQNSVGFFDWVLTSWGCHFVSSHTKCRTPIEIAQVVGRGIGFGERVFRECPQKIVNLPKQGRGMEGGSSLHIHSSKRTSRRPPPKASRGPLLQEGPRGAMTWCQEHAAEPICPSPQLERGLGLPLRHHHSSQFHPRPVPQETPKTSPKSLRAKPGSPWP